VSEEPVSEVTVSSGTISENTTLASPRWPFCFLADSLTRWPLYRLTGLSLTASLTRRFLASRSFAGRFLTNRFLANRFLAPTERTS
jgi:hypothetical protein